MDPAHGTHAAAIAAPVTADHDSLICEIVELQTDIECKKIDYTTLKIFAERVIQTLPSYSPDVGAQKLRTVRDLLKKKNDMSTQQSDAQFIGQERAQRGTGRTTGTKRCRDGHSGHTSVDNNGDMNKRAAMNKETEEKLAAFRAYAVGRLKDAEGIGPSDLLQGYERTAGVKLPHSIFNNHYLHMRDLRRAAMEDDIALAPIAPGRLAFSTIEEGIAATKEKNKPNVRAAADWCVAELKKMLGRSNDSTESSLSGYIPTNFRKLLLERWEADSQQPARFSLSSQFNNGKFSL